MKPYCTKDNILVTEETLGLFKKTVFSIPFDKTACGYKKQGYYRSIALFLQHLICSATVSRNSKNKARFKGNKKWTYSVPFPYELGVKVCPEAFKASRDLGYERALEKLVEAKIIKIVEKSRMKKLCREFALSKIFLKSLFPEERNNYLKRDDRHTYLTNIFGKRNTEGTLEQFFNQRKGVLGIPKHEITKRDIPSDELRSTVKTVYSQLEPLNINIDKLINFCQKNPTVKNAGYYTRFISHLCEVGVEVISSQPLIVAYRQAYKIANIGSRSFEIGTGFQYLPSKMKWACLEQGFNYDIKGCQLEILKQELKYYGINTKILSVLETDFIKRKLGIDDELVKTVRFSTIFNAGSVSCSPHSSLYKKLNKFYHDKDVMLFLKRWKKATKALKRGLEELAECYLRNGTKNRHGLCVRNAVGQTFNCTYKKSNDGQSKKWRSDVMRRKLLAHMIQGLESRAVYDYVSSHKGVCALEHDGFVSLHKLADDDWKHPYLEIVLKHSC
ncbi:hypothetical protein [Klebsiella sp. BIGb0407]|uniref:hypothetical protein n=1 Tax=Klebsiella sp. BIGb0407 TaxID=2940603 RepID=UPI0021674230|nr:hypothetical protein [Klebsiella sp. BIGb0407]MCS3434033.1 hypothetical protein [Klebsiella sp. BIGb0407]